MSVPLIRDPLRPRVHWLTDLLLALVVTVALVPVLIVGCLVTFLIAMSLHASRPVGTLILIAVTLPVPVWIIRTSRRIGYRIVPVVTGAALFVVTLSGLPGVHLL
ncbi:hypothetical protein ABZW30_05290 [Kitasatospora sp. NPDC004669]|uniref:hypothetical protein n=1 Tax=Kitasatospora sp. NPDC004669 TaxID=3154555 RepID=UPI0033ACF8AD